MRHFITYTGAGVICSGLVALILLVRICCPKLNASVSRHHADGCSVKEGWKWFAKEQTQAQDFKFLCLLSWKRESVWWCTGSGERHAILSTKVSNSIKCTSRLMFCQSHAFLSVSLSLFLHREENHIWFNMITELGHDLRNVPRTTAGTHTSHAERHTTLSLPALVYALPAAPPLPINFIGS